MCYGLGRKLNKTYTFLQYWHLHYWHPPYMKPLVSLFLGVFGFITGVSFYHYVLLRDQFSPVCRGYQLPFIDKVSPSKAAVSPCPTLLKEGAAGPVQKNTVLNLEEVLKGPLEQDDYRILSYIREHYLFPPSDLSVPYNLTHPSVTDTSMGQTKMVLKALKYKKNGFFIECGALDGELRSNTLMLERKFGWTGLLIEGDPSNFALLQGKHRKSWTSPACLATNPYPQEVLFQQAFNRGRISDSKVSKTLLKITRNSPSSSVSSPSSSPPLPQGIAKVQCFPLYSLLSALNISRSVDYLSLDVEGSELKVLETIPFHLLKIKILSVEYIHTPGGREALRKLMGSKGYRVYGEVKDPIHNWANDLIFIHNSLIP